MAAKDALIRHLKTGATTTCNAWSVVRKDGRSFGFSDHDQDLIFEGILFKAESGFVAGALQQSLGLSVDNTEVTGALMDDAITEADIAAGRFDAANVTTWLVNWQNVEERMIRFRGHFGEIERSAGSFKVELRSIMEVLNLSQGQVYQPDCAATLGDRKCRFDLLKGGYIAEGEVQEISAQGEYVIKMLEEYPVKWFERGLATILSGIGKGLSGAVKLDQQARGGRRITMWADFGQRPDIGDVIRVEAGCDKLADTCRAKFDNFLNFRGFPHIPGPDWVASYPVSNQRNDGGSRFK